MTGALDAAEAGLARLREVLTSDPLALWQGGQVDTARLERLRTQAGAAVARASEVARVRADSSARIGSATAAVAAASAA